MTSSRPTCPRFTSCFAFFSAAVKGCFAFFAFAFAFTFAFTFALIMSAADAPATATSSRAPRGGANGTPRPCPAKCSALPCCPRTVASRSSHGVLPPCPASVLIVIDSRRSFFTDAPVRRDCSSRASGDGSPLSSASAFCAAAAVAHPRILSWKKLDGLARPNW